MGRIADKTVVGRNNYQELMRKNTLSVIQNAIDELKFLDEEVTKAKLMEMTGLSSATFSKEHVKALLKENKVCQFKDIRSIERQIMAEKLFTMESAELMIQQKRAEARRVDMEQSRDKYKDLYEKTKRQKEALANENELLRGRIHRILMEAKAKGYDLATGFDVI